MCLGSVGPGAEIWGRSEASINDTDSGVIGSESLGDEITVISAINKAACPRPIIRSNPGRR